MVKSEVRHSADSLEPRLRKLNRKQKKTKAKKEATRRVPLPGSFRHSWRSLKVIKQYWPPLFGIMAVYLILNVIFASGISSLNAAVNDIKFNLEISDSENLSPLGTALSGFSNLVASAGTSGSSTGSVLQTFLIVIVSLVLIWALRHLLAGKKVRVKQAYYSAMSPLIPFLLVLVVIFIQLLPVLIGVPLASAILAAVFPSGGALASLTLIAVSVSFLGWSLYMLSSSVFSIYIVTLPDMPPRRALKSAKDLVKFRRWTLMRRLIYLPIFILVVMGLIVVPLIIYATFLVAPVFFGLGVLSLLFIHVYLYTLYRELIK
ncbi:hypothetical protein A2708_02210 [Candidatus Saccharibacteria bacterium RIFCSPHIGHO2_01_FULL_49_21]|nr:MAG: hypothetical protein A2708_02210 [Candidatus Saccharibacteria bacterium RIFCSPHIGHO2_01_FULL_49_21]OGL37959.1 MAG: hypothetical protein A3B63_01360 [Candidatus Saccharibacteria bacterium RIFCSPLOWO2_01_FULL_49_22]